jgi:hypothetical protein
VDELVPLVPEASVGAGVRTADLLLPSPKQAQRATKPAAA